MHPNTLVQRVFVVLIGGFQVLRKGGRRSLCEATKTIAIGFTISRSIFAMGHRIIIKVMGVYARVVVNSNALRHDLPLTTSDVTRSIGIISGYNIKTKRPWGKGVAYPHS